LNLKILTPTTDQSGKRQNESNAKEKTNEWRELYRCLLELYIKLCIILTH